MKLHSIIIITILATVALAPRSLRAQENTELADGAIRVENFRVNNSGDHLVVAFDLNLDSLRMESNRFMAFTPVVKSEADSALLKLPAVMLTGRRQHIVYRREGSKLYPDARETRRVNGTAQTVNYLHTVDAEPWMQQAEVSLVEDLCGCGLTLSSRELAMQLPAAVVEEEPAKEELHFVFNDYIVPAVEAHKTRSLEGRAFLDFPVNKTVIYPDYRKNPVELAKILATIDTVKNDPAVRVTGISIHGYASPESPYQHNTNLARGRAAALKEYVKKQYDFSDDIFHVEFTPEDWAGLRQYVAEHTELTDRDAILALIDSDREPDNKEWAIKSRYPQTYKQLLATVYPALRHSDYVITYEVRAFSDVAEIARLLHTRPHHLSLQEMFLLAQTYEVGSPEFNEVFDIAVRLFPDDPVANTNAAITALNREDLPAAERYLSRAGHSPQAEKARAAYRLLINK